MEDDWEALAEKETIVILPKVPTNVNKWDGEDEDDDVKDSWEDEEDEKKDKEKMEITPMSTKLKPKKSLQMKLEEKEKKRQEEEEQLELDRLANMTPEQKRIEKLRQQQLEKESDLKTALETFGISEMPSGLDSFFPTNKPEFDDFATALINKVNQFKEAEEYQYLLETFIRGTCANLNSGDLKKIKITIDSLHLEKQKLEKANTKKPVSKGKTKVKLRIEQDNVKSNDMGDYGEGFEDDYDDFM